MSLRSDIYTMRKLLGPQSPGDALPALCAQLDKFKALCHSSEEFLVYEDAEGRRTPTGLAAEAAMIYIHWCTLVAALDHASLNNMIRYTEEALAIHVRNMEDDPRRGHNSSTP